ncbi:MAG: prolyl oligopeptidase family serine peptidase [Verrucomicrobiae bacterium]|nr:prolyl oligopeptidase family serine peptidase [Verrucomicrobiae bacterium]
MQSAHRFDTSLTRAVSLSYLKYLPKGYEADTNREWPLILFLHGAGERGSDLKQVAVHGPPNLVSKHPREAKSETAADRESRLEAIRLLKDNFIVVSPQCPANDLWHAEDLEALLNDIEKNHRVDKKRIHLTGLSMGGFGTWDLGLKLPERFATLTPICGGINSIVTLLNRRHPTRGKRQQELPIWIFHGLKDTTVPPAESERAKALLEKLGNKKIKATWYPDAGHDSWTATYADPELYRWFLANPKQ